MTTAFWETIFSDVPAGKAPNGVEKVASDELNSLMSELFDQSKVAEEETDDEGYTDSHEEAAEESEEAAKEEKKTAAKKKVAEDKMPFEEKKDEEDKEESSSDEESQDKEAAIRSALSFYLGDNPAKLAEHQSLVYAKEMVKQAEALASEREFNARLMAHVVSDELTKIASLEAEGVSFLDYMSYLSQQ